MIYSLQYLFGENYVYGILNTFIRNFVPGGTMISYAT